MPVVINAIVSLKTTNAIPYSVPRYRVLLDLIYLIARVLGVILLLLSGFYFVLLRGVAIRINFFYFWTCLVI